MPANQKDIEVGRNKKLTDTGGVDTGRIPRSHQLILIALTGFVIVAGVITLVVSIVSSADSSLSTRDYEKISCTEDSPTPMQINACLKLNCTFDLSTCGESCPFGYVLDNNGCEYNCECAGEGLFEGDISFSENDVMDLTKVYGYFTLESDFSIFSGSAHTGKLWTDTTINGRHKISYEISSATPGAEMAMREAIKRFGEQTCIDFVERTNEDMYFTFSSGESCWSVIGKHHDGQQVVISKKCEYAYIVQHELLHLLGFFHEHSRPDRDSYVIFNEENVEEGKAYNFKKRMESQVKSLGSEYDVESVMHYPSTMFSRNGKPTLVKRDDGGYINSKGTGFTKDDVYEVNALYNCLKSDDSAEWSLWTQWSDCDKTCGNGEQTRFRNCMKEERLVSGCEGEKIESSVCQAEACPSPGGVWGSWGEYGECSNDCGRGVRWRERTCTPERACKGFYYSGDICDSDLCAKPSWGLWTTWTDCSATCGGGWTARQRLCKMEDGTSAITCDADSPSATERKERKCNTRECGSAEPNWGMWKSWSSCTATCGGGLMTRRRQCYHTDGARAYTCDTNERSGIQDEEIKCNPEQCEYLESNWGMWTTWSSCNETCGGGSMSRRRQCSKTDGTRSFSCNSDIETDVQEKECNTNQCVSTDHCEFTESGICYWSYIKKSLLTFSQAQHVCSINRGVIAYFPTELAYTSAMTNLRSKLKFASVSAFTGVMVDAQSLKVTLPDDDVYSKWYPGYPSPCKDCTSVYLYVMSNPYYVSQGMWNYLPTYKTNAVVCQKNQN